MDTLGVLRACAHKRQRLPVRLAVHIACEVLDTAPDQGSQLIRQAMDYSWVLPKQTYVLRAVYERPSRVSIERISGPRPPAKSTVITWWRYPASSSDNAIGAPA